MTKRSQLDLIGKELAELEEQSKWYKRLINEYKKQKKVYLSVTVPGALCKRMKSLLEHLDKDYELDLDDEFDPEYYEAAKKDNSRKYEVNDLFKMLAYDILLQYGKRVDPKRLCSWLKEKQGKSVKKYDSNEEFIMNYDVKERPIVITVSLPYHKVLALEWICDDLENIEDGHSYTVEDVLRITFINFSLRTKKGEVKDLAAKIDYFVRGAFA